MPNKDFTLKVLINFFYLYSIKYRFINEKGDCFMEKNLYPDFAICDSGLGGYPFYKALKERLPDASIVYVSDTENFPYGNKSYGEIVDLSLAFISKVEKQYYPKNMIIACNTISITAGQMILGTFQYWNNIILTLPPIKQAVSISQNKRIGLLATNATIESQLIQNFINFHSDEYAIIPRADSNLISFIQNNYRGSTLEERMEAIKPAVKFFKSTGCDVVILGCTHFLNLKDEFIKSSENAFKVIDSMENVINLAVRIYNREKKN